MLYHSLMANHSLTHNTLSGNRCTLTTGFQVHASLFIVVMWSYELEL